MKNLIHSILSKLNVQCPFSDLFGKSGRKFMDELSLREPYDTHLRSALRVLDAIQPEVKAMKREICEVLRDQPLAEILRSAPGIAELTAYLILHEVGPIERFRTQRQFVKYCCLSPGTWRSAAKHRDMPIGRVGNLYLKAAFVESTQAAVRTDPALGTYYRRLRNRKGTATAMVATARRLAVAVYHMLKKRERYQAPRQVSRRSGKPRLCHGQQR
jgi:transposase